MNCDGANTLAWMPDQVLRNPQRDCRVSREPGTHQPTRARVIEGEAARNLGQEEKWELLSPFLTKHGREGIAYATLQAGMEYFIAESGYIAYTRGRHPLLARRPKLHGAHRRPGGNRAAAAQPGCAGRTPIMLPGRGRVEPAPVELRPGLARRQRKPAAPGAGWPALDSNP